jgi:hypothetical protein
MKVSKARKVVTKVADAAIDRRDSNYIDKARKKVGKVHNANDKNLGKSKASKARASHGKSLDEQVAGLTSARDTKKAKKAK